MTDPPNDEQNKRNTVAMAMRILGEHFDHVQVLVSWNEQGTTQRLFEGGGNWYARQGMAHEFIKCDDAQTNAFELNKILPKPDESGDDWKA